jgi:hypothetical protein
MIDRHAALGDHFLQVPKAQAVRQIPAHAQQDQRTFKMTPLEHLGPISTAQNLAPHSQPAASLRQNRSLSRF